MNSRFLAFLLLAQVVLYGFFWLRMDIGISDFSAYYATATIWKRGGQPYDYSAQSEVERPYLKSSPMPFAHPPLLLPFMAALSGESYAASYWRWCALLVALMAATFAFGYRRLADTATAAQAALYCPAIISLSFANDTALVLAGVTAFACLMCSGRDLWAGAALALTLVKPQYGIIIAASLGFARPRVVIGFSLASLVATLYSYALVGAEGFRGILRLTALMAHGKDASVLTERMVNAAGMLARADLNPKLSWLLFAAAIVGMSLLWRVFRGASGEPTRCLLAVSITVALFASPHAHQYDAALLAPAMLLVRWSFVRIAAASLLVLICASFGVGYVALHLTMVALCLTAVRGPWANGLSQGRNRVSASAQNARRARCSALGELHVET